jgi:hypothetical protein
MSAITRMTNVMLDILETPFLMSAVLMDEFWDKTTSEWTLRREWDGRSRAETHERSRAHRKHGRGRSVRTESHSRKAA